MGADLDLPSPARLLVCSLLALKIPEMRLLGVGFG